MNWFRKMMYRFRGLTTAVNRYPLTGVFLLTAAVITSVSISLEKSYEKQILTCIVGAVLCASLQAAYERFGSGRIIRFVLMGCGLALTGGYYLVLRMAPRLSAEIEIRTTVALLALGMAFIWVPVIRSRVSFNESFMAVFKAFFHSAFYSIVIYGGCSLIILAINTLIIHVDYRAYAHTANIVFALFAPLFFFSLIPVYPGKKSRAADSEENFIQDELIRKAAFCPKFLEILISYIIIPLTAVFTIILLLYITLNIRGAFWENNLLEPMLVSYAVTVILLYILSSRLENKFARLFRLICPKVLVPIVLFQIVASVISLKDIGVTHTRYFVILFGIFAVSAGMVMSMMPVRKNGSIAVMLIIFSIVSILPPVDAFSVSRFSQKKMLKSVLIQNGMLENNRIKPKSSISDEDKKKIVSSVEYLDRMGYTGQISWLPERFTAYEDFYDTFGFHEYDLPEKINQSVNVFLNASVPIDVAGYDFLAHTNINTDEKMESQICNIEKAGRKYVLVKKKIGKQYDIILTDDKNQEVLRFRTDEIFKRYRSYATDKSEISREEATFFTENQQAKLAVIVQEAGINISFNQRFYFADLYVLVRFK